MAHLLKTDGTQTEIQPKNKKKGFQLEELYALLECTMIEVVPLSDGRIMIIDEEGRFNSEAVENEAATQLFRIGRDFPIDWMLAGLDNIIGHAVVCNDDELH